MHHGGPLRRQGPNTKRGRPVTPLLSDPEVYEPEGG